MGRVAVGRRECYGSKPLPVTNHRGFDLKSCQRARQEREIAALSGISIDLLYEHGLGKWMDGSWTTEREQERSGYGSGKRMNESCSMERKQERSGYEPRKTR